MASDVIVRAIRKTGFTTVSTALIRDSRISYGATGLMIDLLSNSDSWKLNLENLANRKTDRHTKIMGYVRELQKFGYLIINRERNEHGKFARTVWTVFEESQLEIQEIQNKVEVDVQPQVDFPSMVTPRMDSPHVEDHVLRNNNVKNNQFEETTTEIIAFQKQLLRIGDIVKPYESEIMKAMTVNNLTYEKMQNLLDELEKYLQRGKVTNPVGWIIAMAKGEFKKPEPLPQQRRYPEFSRSITNKDRSEMPAATREILKNFIRRAT